MSISKSIKPEKSQTRCSSKLILALLEQRINQEDVKKALTHLANCPRCRRQAAFVCQAMAAEREGSYPVLTPEERQSTIVHVNDLIQKKDKIQQHHLWDYWLKRTENLSIFRVNTDEPEVIAARMESSELYFRSIAPPASRYFWQAVLDIKDHTAETLKITLTNGSEEKIAAGEFLLCNMKAKIENGICLVNKKEFMENLFSQSERKYFAALRYPDKTIAAGQPVLS